MNRLNPLAPVKSQVADAEEANAGRISPPRELALGYVAALLLL